MGKNHKRTQKKSHIAKTANNTNQSNSNNLTVLWGEFRGNVDKFVVYEESIADLFSQMIHRPSDEFSYHHYHKTSKGYTFVMEGGYTLKIGKFAQFAKEHPYCADKYKRDTAKGLRQDPELIRANAAKDSKDGWKSFNDDTMVVWQAYDGATHSAYELFQDPSDAEKQFEGLSKYFGCTPTEADGLRFIEMRPQSKCYIGTFGKWKECFPEDYEAFLATKKVQRHILSDFYPELDNRIVIWQLELIDGVEELVCCHFEDTATVAEAINELRASMGLEMNGGPVDEERGGMMKSTDPTEPTYCVAKFKVFRKMFSEADKLVEAYILGKDYCIFHMTDYVPMFE